MRRLVRGENSDRWAEADEAVDAKLTELKERSGLTRWMTANCMATHGNVFADLGTVRNLRFNSSSRVHHNQSSVWSKTE